MAGRKVSQAGYDLIKGFEGLRLQAYKDGGGTVTIGYGNTCYKDERTEVKENDTITQTEAEDLFAYWVDRKFAPDVDQLVGNNVTLNQQQFDALVSFTYNLGQKNLRTSTLLKKVHNDPNDRTIRQEFMKWVKVKSVPCQGLMNRRIKEADFYFS